MFNFHKISSYETSHVFLNVLPMMVISLSNFGCIKIYDLICRVLYYATLWMPLVYSPILEKYSQYIVASPIYIQTLVWQ